MEDKISVKLIWEWIVLNISISYKNEDKKKLERKIIGRFMLKKMFELLTMYLYNVIINLTICEQTLKYRMYPSSNKF